MVESDPKVTSEATKSKAIERPLKTKHKLQCKWTFWFLKGDRTREWEDCLKAIATFDTVEEFWGLYMQLIPASGLTYGSDFYLFKEGIKPMWEDPGNVRGGRWFVVIEKQARNTKLDALWLELMMAVLGGQFKDHNKSICGAAMNLRQKGDKVALWTSDSNREDINRRIGLIFKNKLSLVDESIRYEVHKDASARVSSMSKPKYSIGNK